MEPDLTPEAIADALRGDPLFDAGRLKTGGRREVMASIRRWQRGGRRVFVVLLPREAELGRYREIWRILALDAGRDLLLLSNGAQWVAAGWGLSDPRLTAALDRAEDARRHYLGRGITAALDNLAAEASPRAPATPAPATRTPSGAPRRPGSREGGFGGWPVAGGAAAVIVGLVGFALYRRRRRAIEARASFDAAFREVEEACADLVIEAERQGLAGSDDVQIRASRLQSELEAVARDVRSHPARAAEPFVHGRLRQIGNEIAALRSRQLQNRSS